MTDRSGEPAHNAQDRPPGDAFGSPGWVAMPADAHSAGSPPERMRSLRRAATLTALVGGAHAVLFLVSFWLMSAVPGASSSTSELVAFYGNSGDRRVVIVGLYLMPFAGMAFIWFVVALRMWVEGAAQGVSVLLSNIQLVSGILYIALLFAGAASTTVLAASVEFAEGEIDPVVAHQFPVFGSSLMLVFALRMAAMFVLATSTIGRSSGVLPRWFCWAGYVVGGFLLLTATMHNWFALVFPGWLIVLSVILTMRARRISPDLMVGRLPRQGVVVVHGEG